MAGGGTNSSNPLGPQQGQSTPPTGGTGQMPSFANNPFGPPQQNTGGGFGGQQPPIMMPIGQLLRGGGGGGGGGFGGGQQQPSPFSQLPTRPQQELKVPDWVQAPDPGMATGQAFTELTNPTTGEKFMAPSTGYSVRGQQQPNLGQQPTQETFQEQQQALQAMRRSSGGFGGPQSMQNPFQPQQPFGGQFGQSMQNPFQPQQPAFMQSPEYQGYQTQMQGLQQQMNDYMQKAPMYQQLQDLQGKMQGYHDNYARQQQQQMMQRPSPFRRGQFQQPMGLMGLMGGRGGMGMASPGSYEQYANTNNQALARASQEVKRPTMSRADFDVRNIMSMGMPQARGFESDYRALMKNGGKV